MTASNLETAFVLDRQVSENVETLIRRTKASQSSVGAAVGMSQPTMSRRLKNEQPWLLWEVTALASHFGVTLEQLMGTLPSLLEWRATRSDAITDRLCPIATLAPAPVAYLSDYRRSA